VLAYVGDGLNGDAVEMELALTLVVYQFKVEVKGNVEEV
jgi:hypothetical protein